MLSLNLCFALPQINPAEQIQTGNLKGLRAVGVIVAELSADLVRSGIFQDDIKTDTEMRLKESGIRVLTGKERLQTPLQPYLYISITSICRNNESRCEVDVSVRLMESIEPERDSGLRTTAAVWQRGVVTTIEKKHFDRVRGVVSDFARAGA